MHYLGKEMPDGCFKKMKNFFFVCTSRGITDPDYLNISDTNLNIGGRVSS